MADNALVINTGTQLTMASDDISSVHYPRVKVALGADGAASDWTGNIPSGTITVLAKGTISTGTVSVSAGTIDSGTVSVIGIRHADEFATVITTGTSDMGTIKAAVSGSALYVTSMAISVGSATNVEIASGGTSTRIAGTFFFSANGGAMLEFNPPLRTASGSALVYKQSAAVSPMSITATGYID